MEKNWNSDIARLDLLLRQGRHGQVRQELSRINAREVPRASLQPLARIARRAGTYSLALRLLNPVCRPAPGMRMDALPGELAEYAMALVKNGSIDEALALLRGIEPRSEPLALLYQAFALFPRWEYLKAIPLLERFGREMAESAYERRVAEVNLLAALIYAKRLDEAERLAERLRDTTARDGQRLLHANALELSAQLAFQAGNHPLARERLQAAGNLLADAPVGDRLFVEKWQAVIELSESQGLSREALDRVRATALGLGHWETLRDCDFHEARYRARPDLFARLYHGTPYPAYRERLLETLCRYGNPPSTWLRLSPELDTSPAVRPIGTLDLAVGEWRESGDAGKPVFRVGGLEHRLLLQLNCDFYKPEKIGSLFAAVYPGEHFNPVSSPLRIHQALRRLRRTLRSHRIPLAIREQRFFYALVPGRDCSLACTALPSSPALRELDLKFRALEAALGDGSRSARELSSELGVSISTVTRLLNEAREAGWIETLGRGPARKYRLSRPRRQAA
ncbi:MAG: winged helix-turn-helix domain-containing protein [Oligoflexia bacterium]|nr:winged helix-turn-helix domain-containing protein [Oligoflexia bacterium]